MNRRFMIVSSGALLLASCTTAPVHNWKIAALPGNIQNGRGQRISVRSIGLPASLGQPGVPQPGPANAANSFNNDLWAAPLATMLQTSMVEDLAQRLPQDTILADGGAIGMLPDQYVEIQVLSFSPDDSGEITLTAQIATRPVNAQNWTLQNFSAQTAGGQTAATISAGMSLLWAKLADEVAGMLR